MEQVLLYLVQDYLQGRLGLEDWATSLDVLLNGLQLNEKALEDLHYFSMNETNDENVIDDINERLDIVRVFINFLEFTKKHHFTTLQGE
jgi:hypothetical protein